MRPRANCCWLDSMCFSVWGFKSCPIASCTTCISWPFLDADGNGSTGTNDGAYMYPKVTTRDDIIGEFEGIFQEQHQPLMEEEKDF